MSKANAKYCGPFFDATYYASFNDTDQTIIEKQEFVASKKDNFLVKD